MADFGESKSNTSYDAASSIKGNRLFRQPEFWSKTADQSKADIWSFGTMVLLLLMPTKISAAIESVFYEMDEDEIVDYINLVLEKPEDQAFKDVLNWMIVKNVDKRISA